MMRKKLLLSVLVLAVAIGTAFGFTAYPPGSNVVAYPMLFDSVTATASGIPVFKAAGAYRVVEVGVAAAVVNSGSLTVQVVKNGTDNVLSSPVSVDTGWAEGAVVSTAAANLAADDNVSLTFGGSSPNLTRVTVLLFLRKQ